MIHPSDRLSPATPRGLVGDENCVVQEGEVSREFNRLVRLLDESFAFFEVFQHKLGPILAPESPEKDVGNPVQSTSSDLGRGLSEVAEKLARFNRNINSVAQRVQL